MRSRLFRTDKQGGAAALGPLEGAIMDVIWEMEEAVTVADVQAALARRAHRVSYSAVKSVLLNLTKKRLLDKNSIGRSNAFHPLLTRSEFEETLVAGVLSSLFKNYRGPLLAHLADELVTDDAAITEFEHRLTAAKDKRHGH